MDVPDAPVRRRSGLYPRLLGHATRLLIEPALRAPYLSTVDWLHAFYGLPSDQRQKWQRARLEEVLAHATSDVPRYRSRAGSGNKLILADFPVVSKDVIRQNMTSFLSATRPLPPYVAKWTSGTTGECWSYPLDKRAWTQTYAAWLFFLGLTGYHYGEPVAVVGPHGARGRTQPTPLGLLRELAERRQVVRSGADLGTATSERRVLEASRRESALWYGYPGILAAMARAVADREGRGRPLAVKRPRAIVTSGEMLHPEWRLQIEQAFGAPVYDQYGCNDGGVLTQSCSAGRFHIAENLSLVEVLQDGQPCAPGVEGSITVTNLHAFVLPFLRYDTGDLGSLGVGTCPCGRPGQTLEAVRGRAWPSVLLPDGREINSLDLSLELIDAPHVRRIQLLQRDPNELRVRLDVSPGFNAAEEERIRTFMSLQCQHALHVTVLTDEEMELTSGGKHPFVIRRV